MGILGSTQPYIEHGNFQDAVTRWIAGTDAEPSAINTQFGSGVGAGSTFLEEGNINRQIFAAAGVSPGATGVDSVLAVFALPANSFDILGRGIALTASGKFATNANTKEVKLFFNATTAVVGSTITGGTAVADSGAQTGSNVGWSLFANIFKLGAAGSNTQYAQCTGAIAGSTHLGLGASSLPLFPTAVENAIILVAVTGNATTTATDIVLNFFEVNAMN